MRRKDGATPLFVACEGGIVDAARLLLDKGAEVDRPKESAGSDSDSDSDSGVTPLIIACKKGHVDVALLLLEKGAEVDRANRWGQTPLSIAKQQRHSSLVALLEKHRK